MKPETPDPLLNEVLDDGAAFRSATLRQTLALARTRRRQRLVNRTLVMSAMLAGAIWWLLPRPPVLESKPAASAMALRIVHTVPLAATDTVRPTTARIATIHTAPTPIVVISSRGDAVARVSSGGSDPMIRYLDDQQLLAAFPGEHPILIFPGTPNAHLVFR